MGLTYAASSSLAGAVHFALWALVGQVVHGMIAVPMQMVALVAGLATLNELGLIRIPYVQRHWQVPDRWVVGSGLVPALKWGASLGFGALTFIPYFSFYIGVVVAIWSSDLRAGAAVGAAYGFGRALPALHSMWTKDASSQLFLPYWRSRPVWNVVLAFGAAGVLATAAWPA